MKKRIRFDRVFGCMFLLAWTIFVVMFCNHHANVTGSESTMWLGVFGGIAIFILVLGNMLDKKLK